MDDPRWLRLVTIGLVLAAIAVGYFLVTSKIPASTSSPKILGQDASPIPVASPGSKSAYSRIAERTTKGGVQTLPNTGFPIGLLGVFSAGVMIAGWGLRKFPH